MVSVDLSAVLCHFDISGAAVLQVTDRTQEPWICKTGRWKRAGGESFLVPEPSPHMAKVYPLDGLHPSRK